MLLLNTIVFPEKGIDKFVANEHYVVALTNQSKVAKATFKK